MMNKEHWILASAWIVYCMLHSVLAAPGIKVRAQSIFGKWYRPFYAVFALVGLIAIAYYQYTINSPLLYERSIYTTVTGFMIAFGGLTIMVRCIVKYFVQLSGIRSLVYGHTNNLLMNDGLHKIVRHPLYLGTFIFIWGIFIAFPYLSWLISSLIITVYTLIGIRFEEAKLRKEFGAQYDEYCKRVPMILPRAKSE